MSAISRYRDDGPLARGIGALARPVASVPAPLLILAALVPLLAVAAFADLSHAAAAGVLAWVLLAAGVSTGARTRVRVSWAEPPLLRATEYTALIWIAALEGADAYPAAFALLAALAFRHYDLVYRRGRHAWVNTLAAGWDVRLVVAFGLLVAGALPAGYYAAAAALGAAFVAEAVSSWAAAGDAR